VPQPVLVAGARTPIGKMLGGLSRLQGPALGGTAIRAALERAGITGNQVDAVIVGNVVQAGVGPNPARLAAVAGGVPMSVPATTVNKLCLSGLAAIAQAAQQIMTGHGEVVVAGGMESMSSAPHLLPGSRRGVRYGEAAFLDSLDSDALVCGFDGVSMGAATERYQAGLGISREDQDAFGAESHARAAAAIKAGRLAEEIVPLAADGRRDGVLVENDEGVRPGTTAERLARLAPAFSEGGTITAGSASQLSDGACALVVMSKDRAEREGLPWIAEIGAYGTVAGPDPSLLLQPAKAIRDARRGHLRRAGPGAEPGRDHRQRGSRPAHRDSRRGRRRPHRPGGHRRAGHRARPEHARPGLGRRRPPRDQCLPRRRPPLRHPHRPACAGLSRGILTTGPHNGPGPYRARHQPRGNRAAIDLRSR
jgi:acetyl-CoA C-acetyltransferase